MKETLKMLEHSHRAETILEFLRWLDGHPTTTEEIIEIHVVDGYGSVEPIDTEIMANLVAEYHNIDTEQVADELRNACSVLNALRGVKAKMHINPLR